MRSNTHARTLASPTPNRKVKDMTPSDINNDSRPRRFRLRTVVAAVALASVIAALPAYASGGGKVSGVRAAVKHGTLNVTGSDGGQQVALRLAAGDPSTIQVDAGNDGSADFSFAAGEVDAIKVKLGDGNDLARIDDTNGAFTDRCSATADRTPGHTATSAVGADTGAAGERRASAAGRSIGEASTDLLARRISGSRLLATLLATQLPGVLPSRLLARTALPCRDTRFAVRDVALLFAPRRLGVPVCVLGLLPPSPASLSARVGVVAHHRQKTYHGENAEERQNATARTSPGNPTN